MTIEYLEAMYEWCRLGVILEKYPELLGDKLEEAKKLYNEYKVYFEKN